MRKQIIHGLRIFPFAIALLTLTAGCGGGGDSDEPEVSEIDVTISGSVGDGPIVGADVVIRDRSGQIIGSQTSNDLANFEVTIKVRGNQFPLTAEVVDGTDLVTGAPPDFPLIGAVMKPGNNRTAHLNPFSTLSIAIAQRMAGGLTESNVTIATGAVLDALSFGLDQSLVADPMTTQITAGNIATLVKASEALSETVRRTRDALMVVGLVTSASEVLDAVAADMVDGIVDGRGAAGSSARIAAVWNLVSAQVLLETMINHLHVGGIDATVAMDIAIQQVMPGSPADSLTSSVAITGEILAQLRTVLDAARVYSDDPALAGLLQTLDLIQPGADPANVEALLPDGSSDVLNGSIAQISVATPMELELINAVVRQGGTVTVPAVVGLSQGQASTAIISANLVVGTVTSQTSSTVSVGNVISQNPVGGTTVAQDSGVNLVVSLGPPPLPTVTVPAVVGLSQGQASTAIISANLVVGTVTSQTSSTVSVGNVISQNPVGGTTVAQDSGVNLVVSLGPPPLPTVTVPAVVGLSQGQASTAIISANLVVGTVTSQTSSTVSVGNVISQNPVGGTTVAQGRAASTWWCRWDRPTSHR